MLSPTATTIRLFLHVAAACIWVGGQFTLAGLVGPLRRQAPDAPKVAARAFNRVAWPAFAVLVVTGVWNLLATDAGDTTTAYKVTLMLKLLVVAASGVGAFVHAQGRSKPALAVGGALAGFGGFIALFLGVLLRSH